MVAKHLSQLEEIPVVVRISLIYFITFLRNKTSKCVYLTLLKGQSQIIQCYKLNYKNRNIFLFNDIYFHYRLGGQNVRTITAIDENAIRSGVYSCATNV